MINLTAHKASYSKVHTDGQITIPRELLSGDFAIRLRTYEDMFYLASAVDARNGEGKGVESLFISYLLGGRSDRRFVTGGSFDLRVICDFINGLGFKYVQVFEPHSDVTMALLRNSYVVNWKWWEAIPEGSIVVSPDAGAYKRLAPQAQMYRYKMISAIKHRSEDGSPEVHLLGDPEGKDCVIVDDLIDGGRTFIALAEQLLKNGASKVSLAAPHSLFSYGVDQLFDAGIDHIYTTNSMRDFDTTDPRISVSNII